MRVGLFAPLVGPPVGPEFVEALGASAEERGYASLWLGEHVVLFDEYDSRYPYMDDGKMPAVGVQQGLLEPFTTLAYLAATTTSLLLGTGVCILPQRKPVVVAKELSNVDLLSGGRVRFGVGLGWQREEFEALATPWEDRGARTDDYIEVVKRLWRDEISEFHGAFYDLPPSRLYPKPVTPGGPPVVIGGDSDAALARVARAGDGWYAFSMTPEELAPRLRTLEDMLAGVGRRRADIEVVVCPYAKPITDEDLDAYAALGVDEVVVMVFAHDLESLARRLDRLGERGLAPH